MTGILPALIACALAAPLRAATANVDEIDRYGNTALARAARDGKLEEVKALLAAGASVHGRGEGKNGPGSYPLAWAVANGRVDVARVLLDAGADPNLDSPRASKTEEERRSWKHAENPDGALPLGLAAYDGSIELVKVLLARGADPSRRRVHQHTLTPLGAALSGGKPEAALLMLEGRRGLSRVAGVSEGSIYTDLFALVMTRFHDPMTKVSAPLITDENARHRVVDALLAAGADPAFVLNHASAGIELGELVYNPFTLARLNSLADRIEGMARQGNTAEAFVVCRESLVPALTGYPAEEKLRIACLRVMARLKTVPPTPADYERRLVRGRSIFESMSGKYILDAAREYVEAIRIAPWRPEAYFNAGMVKEDCGGSCSDVAARFFRYYAAAAPDAPDAEEATRKSWELEVKER